MLGHSATTREISELTSLGLQSRSQSGGVVGGGGAVRVQKVQEFTQGKYLSWADRPGLAVGVGSGVCTEGLRE